MTSAHTVPHCHLTWPASSTALTSCPLGIHDLDMLFELARMILGFPIQDAHKASRPDYRMPACSGFAASAALTPLSLRPSPPPRSAHLAPRPLCSCCLSAFGLHGLSCSAVFDFGRSHGPCAPRCLSAFGFNDPNYSIASASGVPIAFVHFMALSAPQRLALCTFNTCQPSAASVIPPPMPHIKTPNASQRHAFTTKTAIPASASTISPTKIHIFE